MGIHRTINVVRRVRVEAIDPLFGRLKKKSWLLKDQAKKERFDSSDGMYTFWDTRNPLRSSWIKKIRQYYVYGAWQMKWWQCQIPIFSDLSSVKSCGRFSLEYQITGNFAQIKIKRVFGNIEKVTIKLLIQVSIWIKIYRSNENHE